KRTHTHAIQGVGTRIHLTWGLLFPQTLEAVWLLFARPNMPILPLDAYVYPDDLLLDERQSFPSRGEWWVIHTRPRAEKALGRKLLGMERPFFLPLYPKQWRNDGRLHCSFLPLFSGYLFAVGDAGFRGDLLATKQVANVLPVPDQPQ